ncbi:ABC transporter ATP-binding protein [uncultured Nitratireductor sp.]|uniref:ABC transporter ATP-binding protein n=1 Tax=uncultured Nitratireductor sp. TaxID=520953 RepID=UPI0025E8AB1E|nr:ABC transporter ATP-binding protein [uncultured Nitratireductor sp.]
MTASTERTPALEVDDLEISFGARPVVKGVSFQLAPGEIMALVGESGSGKSLLAHAIAGILTPAARVSASRMEFGGVDLAGGSPRARASLRGREIGVVFQNPRAALNPSRTIGRQIADVLREHRGLAGARLTEAVHGALADVRIPEPEMRARAYPGELSGGMCQRVMIAIALAGNPSLLIADEPTTGLDTTTQAAILDLMLGHARERRMATLFITHDLALARAYAERIVVMHAGQIVEEAPTESLFAAPRHPYAAALIGATPADATEVSDLKGIAGSLPDLDGVVPACRFAGRCDRVIARCRDEGPQMVFDAGRHGTACWVPR